MSPPNGRGRPAQAAPDQLAAKLADAPHDTPGHRQAPGRIADERLHDGYRRLGQLFLDPPDSPAARHELAQLGRHGFRDLTALATRLTAPLDPPEAGR